MMNNLIINQENLLESQVFIRNNKDDYYIRESKRIVDEILSLMTHSVFKILEHIDIDNLRYFWLEVLREYQDKTITKNDVLDIVDSLECYLNKRFENDYPEFEWLVFPDSDPRSIGLNAIDFVKDGVSYGNLLPNVIEPILNYLRTPASQERDATTNMEKFMDDFKIKRLEKAEYLPDGSYIITWHQLEDI